MVQFESLGAVSYSSSIVTMAVSVAVCELFSVKEWCDLKSRVRVCSRKWHHLSLVSSARYSSLSIENREICIPHRHLSPPQGVTPSEFREDV